jgi:hypothetical protein
MLLGPLLKCIASLGTRTTVSRCRAIAFVVRAQDPKFGLGETRQQEAVSSYLVVWV